MFAWESIESTLKYIENNISEEIEIEKLAKIANLSQFYYQRLFRRLVKKPVMEYIKLRRLARSTELLKDMNKRILDIAIMFGFNDHSIYTKNFKNIYGITPKEYRENSVRLNHFNKPELLLNYTMIKEKVPLIADGIVIEITRNRLNNIQNFVGFVGEVNVNQQIPVGEATGIDIPGELWNTFHKEKNNILTLKIDGCEIGVSYPSEREGYFNYFVGSEADKIENDYKSWILPKGEYIVCKFEAEDVDKLVTDALNKAINYLFGTWLFNNNIEIEDLSVEKYTGKKNNPPYMEVWGLIK